MRSEAATSLTGYRQPAQARVFGRAEVIVVALVVALLLSILLTLPPATAIDGGRTITFSVESIPLEQPEQRPQPASADPVPSAASAPSASEASAASPQSPVPVAPAIVSLPEPLIGSHSPGTLPDGRPPVFHGIPVTPAAAIGWLWVAEGSNLGASSLLKRAAAFGLDAAFGARHLAGHPAGRGAQWKSFTAAVDALDRDDGQDTMMVRGACDAFAHVRRLADASFV